jgi:hypothetical protein
MSALSLPLVVLAMAMSAAWMGATVLFPLWTMILRRWPAFGRGSILVAALPMAIGFAFAIAAILPGDPHLAQPFGCHCGTSMPGWMHLCPVHPGNAVGLLPVALMVVAMLLPGRLTALRRLVAEPLGLGGGSSPTFMDLPSRTAMLVGWYKPSLAIDNLFWKTLNAEQRRAVLAHERAHLDRRDPLLLMVHRLLVSVGPAGIGRQVTRAWLDGAELRADAVAAAATDPAQLASALVQCARLGNAPVPTVPCWNGGQLEQRVEALLSNKTASASARPDAGFFDAFVLISICIATLSTSPWLHHQVEHLLNLSF